MDFTLKQLSYFVAVAQHGSLTGAANALDLSQSAMSNAIAELERSLGVQLMVRQAARGMFLTTAGELLLAKATRLLEDVEEMAAQVRSTDLLLRGRLRVGCYLSLIDTVMPSVLTEFMTAYPDVHVELREGIETELITWLRAGKCDLIVTYGVHLPDDVEFTALASLRSYVLVSVDHPLSSRKHIDIPDLQDTPLILLDIPPSRDFFLGILQSVGFTQAPKFKSSSIQVVRSLVAGNLGFTILTQPRLGLDESGTKGRLKAFPITLDSALVDVGVAKLRATTLTRRAQAFNTVLRQVLPGELGGRRRSRGRGEGVRDA